MNTSPPAKMFLLRSLFVAAACAFVSPLTATLTENDPLIPAPGGIFSETVSAAPLRTGAVLLRWWTAAPAETRVTVRRRTVTDSSAAWVTLGTVTGDSFVDRTARAGQTYDYELIIEGLSEDDVSERATVRAVVGDEVPPAQLKRFEVGIRDGQFVAEWLPEPESRLDGYRLFGIDGEGAEVLLAEPAFHETRVTFATVPSFQYFALEWYVDGSAGRAGRMEARLGSELSLTLPAQSGRTPQLFLTDAAIAETRRQMESVPPLLQAFQRFQEDARNSFEVVKALPENLDEVGIGGGHRTVAYHLRQTALAHRFDPDPERFEVVRQVLLAYADLYPQKTPARRNISGHLSVQTLQEAMMLIHFTWAFDLVRDQLSEADEAAILGGLFRTAADFLVTQRRWRSNWQSWHNTCLLALGILLHDQEVVDYALEGPFGLNWQFRETLGRDGLYYGQSIAYHYFTMNPFTLAAVLLENKGVDFWHYQDGERTLRRMFDVSFWHAFSDGRQVPFGNSQVNYPIRAPWIAWNYGAAYAQYQDPSYAWLLFESGGLGRRDDRRMPSFLAARSLYDQDGARVAAEPFLIPGQAEDGSAVRHLSGSTLLEDVGMLVLRGDPVETAGETAFIWKPQGKTAGHQRANALAFHWQSAEHDWIPGAGKWAGYTTPEHLRWVMHTLTDNTLLVNRRSHQPLEHNSPNWRTDEPGKPTHGNLVNWTAGPVFSFAHGFTNRAYADTRLTRKIWHNRDYTLELSSALSREPATIDHVLHVHGVLEDASVEWAEADGNLADQFGYSFLAERLTAQSDSGLISVWKRDGNVDSDERLYLTQLPLGPRTYHLARTPWADNRERSTLLTSAEGTEASFLSLWAASSDGNPFALIDWLREPDGSGQGTLRVALKDGLLDLYSWSLDGEGTNLPQVHWRGREAAIRYVDDLPIDATFLEADQYEGGAIQIQLAHPSNFSVRVLGDDAFLFLYDDAHSGTVTLGSETQPWQAVLLDYSGAETKIAAWMPVEGTEDRWALPPRSAVLFYTGDLPPELPVLSLRIGADR